MEDRPTRTLTTLEYIVLGLISTGPQSGYSIVSFFDEDSYNSWSASPGTVYPMLKRLEKQGVIVGELEMEHETRPRKMYTLTATGEELLHKWLKEVPKMRPFYEQREMAMMRFQFMEERLPLHEILQWLKNYLDAIHYATHGSTFYKERINQAMEEEGKVSVHTQLLMEGYMMELSTLRTWLEMAQARLTVLAHQTGEFPVTGSNQEG